MLHSQQALVISTGKIDQIGPELMLSEWGELITLRKKWYVIREILSELALLCAYVHSK